MSSWSNGSGSVGAVATRKTTTPISKKPPMTAAGKNQGWTRLDKAACLDMDYTVANKEGGLSNSQTNARWNLPLATDVSSSQRTQESSGTRKRQGGGNQKIKVNPSAPCAARLSPTHGGVIPILFRASSPTQPLNPRNFLRLWAVYGCAVTLSLEVAPHAQEGVTQPRRQSMYQ